MAATSPAPLLTPLTAAELSSKCVTDEVGALNCLCVTLGHKLGLFSQLKRLGPTSAAGLASAAAVSERWVQEWLYQQAASGYICCDESAVMFWLSEAQKLVLVPSERLDDAAESPLEFVLMAPKLLGRCDALAECFCSGRGLTFDDLGTDYMCQTHRHARALQMQKNLASLPGLQDKLLQGVTVADVGCGSGEVLLHLAATYPASSFIGYDVSGQALQVARQHQAERGLNNVTFLNPEDEGGKAMLPCRPTFHVVLVQEAIHDMAQPQDTLQQIRKSLLPDSIDNCAEPQQPQPQQPQQQELADALNGYSGGPVFVLTDVKSEVSPPANIAGPAGPLLYGLSVSVCLSSGLSQDGGAGLGTVGFNEDVARQMCAAAGFTRFTKLTWEPSMFNSHYLLRA